MALSGPFEDGDRALLIDGKGRRYLIRLHTGGEFHYHGGVVPHSLIIGSDEGTVVHSTLAGTLTCFRPRLSDFILKMPRGAQVVYPKDLGAILVHVDVFPGLRILEAGTGSGSLTITLARAVGPTGAVVTYELREDFHRKATENVEAFLGGIPQWLELRLGDLREVAETSEQFDRVILDMPEPWGLLKEASSTLVPGGLLCGFLPTTGQVQQLVLALQDHGFDEIETFETMHRTWHVTERSVRPDHRMVAHTGFITVARLGGSGRRSADISDQL
jgi:tRNA (adenine57-N1/adenine58-N1)-methyltransferase catalytic subunit